MKTYAYILAVLACLLPWSVSANTPKVPTIVFDFVSKHDRPAGLQLADSLRLRLRRTGHFEVLDRLTTQENTEPINPNLPQDKAIEQVEATGAKLAVYGSLHKGTDQLIADVVCIRLKPSAKPAVWRKTFTGRTQRATTIISKKIALAITQDPEWAPPEYGDEIEPKQFAKPLNPNGDFETFETFDKSAAGWDPPDFVSTFIIDGPPKRGKVLKVRTDLKRDPWLAWRRKIILGQVTPTAANAPKIARDTGYSSVGGLEGMHYRSTWIKATPGMRYWLVADGMNKSKGVSSPKVFIKGYLDWSARAASIPESSLARLTITPEQFAAMSADKRRKLIKADSRKHPEHYRRECYRWYLSCKNRPGQWKHFAAPFPPRGGLPKNVKWLQIQIYSYWPPGEYLWDNVHLYADPRQKAPIAEAGARTHDSPPSRSAKEKPKAKE